MTPTWATDWQFQPDRVDFLHNWQAYGYTGFRNAYPNLQEIIETAHSSRADRSWKDNLTTFEGSKFLKCSGIRIGTLDGISSGIPAQEVDDPDYIAPEHIQPQERNNPYGDDVSIRRALVHTLCANPIWGDEEESSLFRIPWITGKTYSKAQDLAEEPFWIENLGKMSRMGWSPVFAYAYYSSFELTRRILGGYQISGRPFRDWFDQEIVELSMPLDRVFLDLAKVVGAQLGRRLATMNTGHFGLIPNTALRGDSIYAILGCPFPVALRQPAAGAPHFEIIGECYIEGFARGEAIDGFENGKYELESISLC
jgi:hypothetical protein